jgi:hypothetical protein
VASILARLDRLERHLRLAEPDDGEAVKARLIDRLETMAARLRASPDWHEPTPAELAAVREMLVRYRREGAERAAGAT